MGTKLNPNLTFNNVFSLDRAQKKKDISDDDYKYLKKLGFVEGRKPNVFLSQQLIGPLNDEGLKAEYIRNKGFNDTYCKDLIIEYLARWKEASRKQIENLLWDKLSDVLDEKSKKNKIMHLLQSLRKNNTIIITKGKKWVLKS